MYQYKIEVLRVVDGDTLEVDVDLGFSVWLRKVKFRLYGINCPEKNTPEGVEAKQFTTQMLLQEKDLYADTVKEDKYGGRWDARVYFSNGKCLNDSILSAGHAKPFMVKEPPPPYLVS